MLAHAQSALRPNQLTAVAAWAVMLAISSLPDAALHELTGAIPGWLIWAKMSTLIVMLGVTFVWHAVRPLRNFFLILLAIYAAELSVMQLSASMVWQSWFGSRNASFTLSMFSEQSGRLMVSLVLIGVLLALRYRRADFFLVRGKLDAPIEPVKWLGFPKPDAWTRFGAQWCLYLSLGLLVFLIIFGRPVWPGFAQAAPMLPAVLLFAAMNAFSEELTYRSSLLASLENVIGPRPALWNAALFFGIGHYFGVPYGVLGVAMATFLGWLLGKAMLETRGFAWAWFIHFVQDVLIFSFMAAGSITPGG